MKNQRLSLKDRKNNVSEVSTSDVDTLDMYFVAIYVCVGGIAYFLFTLLKSFITQGVV